VSVHTRHQVADGEDKVSVVEAAFFQNWGLKLTELAFHNGPGRPIAVGRAKVTPWNATRNDRWWKLPGSCMCVITAATIAPVL
jgi:hypothetical protein